MKGLHHQRRRLEITRILVSTTTFGTCGRQPLDLLEQAGYKVILNPYGRNLTAQEVGEMAKDCDGIIASVEPLSASVLESLPLLQCISRCGVGTDNIDLNKAKELGIAVMTVPDGPTRGVAELAVGLMIDLLRTISHCDREIRQGKWHKEMGRLLLDRKVGIIGMGRIGRAVAGLLVALGARVAGTDISPDIKWFASTGVSLLSFQDLLEDSEIVSIHIPYSSENRHIIGAKEIASMPKGAYLLNLSRGGVVDEVALYGALSSSHLAGAALDVFEKEPYTGPLIGLDNVVLTPHAGSYARENRLYTETQAVINLLECLSRSSGVNK